MRKPSLGDLNIFIVAANQRSLTAAAATLKMTIATVSRRISALEATLGVELLYRSTKGLTLTPHGESYYRECEELVLALDQRILDLDQTLHSQSGPLKIMAPVNLGSGPLDAFWRHFILRYPEIALTIDPGFTLLIRPPVRSNRLHRTSSADAVTPAEFYHHCWIMFKYPL